MWYDFLKTGYTDQMWNYADMMYDRHQARVKAHMAFLFGRHIQQCYRGNI